MKSEHENQQDIVFPIICTPAGENLHQLGPKFSCTNLSQHHFIILHYKKLTGRLVLVVSPIPQLKYIFPFCVPEH